MNELSGDSFRGTSSNLNSRGIKIILDPQKNPLPRPFSIDVYIDVNHIFIRKVEKIWEGTEESNRLSIGCRFEEISDEATAWLEKIISADNFCSPHPL